MKRSRKGRGQREREKEAGSEYRYGTAIKEVITKSVQNGTIGLEFGNPMTKYSLKRITRNRGRVGLRVD